MEMLNMAGISYWNKQYGQDFHENEQSVPKKFMKMGSAAGILTEIISLCQNFSWKQSFWFEVFVQMSDVDGI